jgi:hypothetical protein
MVKMFAGSAVRGAMVATGLFLFGSIVAVAQDSDHDWQKTYTLSGKAALTIQTSDSGLEIHSCGECKEIRIKVHSGRKLSDYVLEEHQEADHVSFMLKEKPNYGIHVRWKSTTNEHTQVSVETPANLDLEAKTSDGGVAVRSLTGNLQIRSSDGGITLEDLHGSVRLTSSDGDVSIHNATGTLEARTSDGPMKIEGQFTAVQLHTSDGSLDFALAPGSQLTSASQIESSDGRVTIRVPHNLAADLDVSSGDGHIDCALPLTMDHYSNSDSGGHHLHGHLNAGGVPLSIHTSDGNVSIGVL